MTEVKKNRISKGPIRVADLPVTGNSQRTRKNLTPRIRQIEPEGAGERSIKEKTFPATEKGRRSSEKKIPINYNYVYKKKRKTRKVRSRPKRSRSARMDF